MGGKDKFVLLASGNPSTFSRTISTDENDFSSVEIVVYRVFHLFDIKSLWVSDIGFILPYA